MKIMQVDPRKLIVEGTEPPDLSYKEMIQEDGLPLQEGVLPAITVRAHSQSYLVVTGGKYVRAIAALLEENAECLDVRSDQLARAADVYRTVPVGLLG